tara:strand:+ start:637 stop:1203 length:567 start_codon:yes stop_codon:yes gene_type:complete
MKFNSNKYIIFENTKKILFKWGFTKKGLKTNEKGEWYLTIQLILIFLHLLPPWPKLELISYPINIFFISLGLLISLKGIAITYRAFVDLGENLTPLPYPMKESILVKNKSYQYSRHPLYKGLLFISLGISIITQSIFHFFLFILLVYTLRTKARKEEEMLKVKYKDYKNYIKEVPAIIKNINFLDWKS